MGLSKKSCMIISIDITSIYCKAELSVSHDPSEMILKWFFDK